MPHISSMPMQAKWIPELPAQAESVMRQASPGTAGDENHLDRHEEFSPIRRGQRGRPALCIEDHLRRIAIALKGLPKAYLVSLDARTTSALLNPPEVLVPFWPWRRHQIAAEGMRPIIDYLTLLSRVNAPAIPAVRQILAECRQSLAESGQSSGHDRTASQRIANCLDDILSSHVSLKPICLELKYLDLNSLHDAPNSSENAPIRKFRPSEFAQPINVTCVIDDQPYSLSSKLAPQTDQDKALKARLVQKLFEKTKLRPDRQQPIINKLIAELHAKEEIGKAISRIGSILENSGISLTNPRLEFTLTFPENQDAGKVSAINVNASLSCEGYAIRTGKGKEGKKCHYHALQLNSNHPLCRIHVKSTLAWSRTPSKWETTDNGMTAHITSMNPAVCKDFTERLIHHQKELLEKSKSQEPTAPEQKSLTHQSY